MKNFLKFLEENSKWVVRVLIALGLFFIVKLWLVGMQIRERGGGGYLDLSIGWRFDYYWINAGYIALVLLIISFFLIFLIKNTKNKIKKIQIAFLIFLLGIIGKQIFFLVSPDFKFYLTPVTSQYKDKEGMVTDIDKYLELIGKYCPYIGDNSLNFMYSKLDMCSQNDKFQTFFNTADEYIKVLEYAKNNDHKLLYDRTYGGVNKFGVEKILEKYNDETFYGYVFGWEGDNIKILKLMLLNTSNDRLKIIITELINKMDYFNNNNFIKDERNKYFDDIFKDLEIKLKDTPEINKEILLK